MIPAGASRTAIYEHGLAVFRDQDFAPGMSWHNALNDYHGHPHEMHGITLSGEELAA